MTQVENKDQRRNPFHKNYNYMFHHDVQKTIILLETPKNSEDEKKEKIKKKMSMAEEIKSRNKLKVAWSMKSLPKKASPMRRDLSLQSLDPLTLGKKYG